MNINYEKFDTFKSDAKLSGLTHDRLQRFTCPCRYSPMDSA